eukprot:TRINITY_DN9587_c0_g1_i17.p3 TRINITY_DN9587_c0_g1~~TRINITY_DN9587_c0_g1_i17.p3  ORF type:complete len:110 (-),score=23.26 TRINITY_DN9587_c0_g1_i17:873-1202(-)
MATFVDFVDEFVKPLKEANPSSIRLDGRESGGNRDVAGMFTHIGKQWVVHADSHFEPLMLAYDSMKAGTDPFQEADTPRGQCLILSDDLRQDRNSPKYLYIYNWGKPTE